MAQFTPASDADLAETHVAVEQRKYPRHLCLEGGVVRLSIRPNFKGRRAVLIDISTGGIGFVLENPLEAGSMLVFELGELSANRIARVRHCRPHPTPPGAPWANKPRTVSRFFRTLLGMKDPEPPPSAWMVGCAFDRPLSNEELQQLVSVLAQAEFPQC